MSHDLVLKGARVIDPAQGIDRRADVGFSGERVTSIGVDPDDYARQAGTTTLVDAGSAGPGNFPGFRKHVMEPATARILAYLNI